MTEVEIAAIVEGIGPVVQAFVARAVAELLAQQTATHTQVAMVGEATKEIGGLRERVAALEARAPVPGPPGPADQDLASVVRETVIVATAGIVQRQAVLETQVAPLIEAAKDTGALRERVAILEMRAPVPGPPGPAGRDGTDGLGFDDLAVTQRDDRSFVIAAAQGDRVKDIGTARFAVDLYRGVWIEGRAYEPGDGVTWAGSEWHCQTATTTKPGEGSKAWTLKVKRGRDGKDGKDGALGPPGPPGRDWQQVYDETRRR